LVDNPMRVPDQSDFIVTLERDCDCDDLPGRRGTLAGGH
jgi:hypothetical protein